MHAALHAALRGPPPRHAAAPACPALPALPPYHPTNLPSHHLHPLARPRPWPQEAQGQIAAFYAELKEKSGKRAAENLTAQGQYITERDAAIQADPRDLQPSAELQSSPPPQPRA